MAPEGVAALTTPAPRAQKGTTMNSNLPDINRPLNIFKIPIATRHAHNYKAFFNPTVEQVEEYAKLMPREAIFVFLIGDMDEVQNWNTALRNCEYLMPPIFIGDVSAETAQSVAAQIVSNTLSAA